MIQLYKYQKEYLQKTKPNFIFDCDTGTGKTIMALEHYLKHSSTSLLIVAPASKINEGGWQRTIQEHYPQINYDTCTYNMLNKKYMNYKNYFIIFDECHRLKNSCGVWGKAGYALSKISSGFILLSATPIPNGWEDAINYFKIFNLTKNKTQFINQYAIYTTRFGYMDIIGWKEENKLNKMWNSISHRLSKEDAIDLPDLLFREVYFKASTKYNKIKKDRVYEDIIYDNQMKLRHGLKLYTQLKDKINYVKEFIESTTDNIVIFYNYIEEFKLLKECVVKSKKPLFVCNGDDKNYPKKDEWNTIHNSITLANYKSGSEAVEFTYSNIIIYFSPTDSYTEYYQSYGRCYRNGQKKKVTILKFITLKTIDESVYKALDKKQDFNFKLWEQENIMKKGGN